MKFPNLTVKMETTHLSDFNYDIIIEITITMSIALSDCIREYKKSSTIMNAYSRLTSSEKNLSRVFMILLIPNTDLEHGIHPGEIYNRLEEISKVFLKESKETFLNRRSTRSKLLKEFENRGIFSSVIGRENIKRESTKNVGRKPKEEWVRLEGYPIEYKLTGTVQEYKKILSNPQCTYIINEMLRKYGILEKVYDLISRQAFHFFKTGDEKMYDFLKTFGVILPELDPNVVPDSKAFREQINALRPEELENLREELVQHLLNNPNSSVLLVFSLTKLAGS